MGARLSEDASEAASFGASVCVSLSLVSSVLAAMADRTGSKQMSTRRHAAALYTLQQFSTKYHETSIFKVDLQLPTTLAGGTRSSDVEAKKVHDGEAEEKFCARGSKSSKTQSRRSHTQYSSTFAFATVAVAEKAREPILCRER